MWVAWFRRATDQPWEPLLAGNDERDVIIQVNHARRTEGEWMVLADGQDPNAPAGKFNGGSHYGYSASPRGEALAVERGRFAERLHRGRR